MNNKIMYSEVYAFLNILGNSYIEKISKKLYEIIKQKSIKDYKLQLNMKQSVSEQISEDALAFILYLNLNYWATVEEKEELIKVYKENDRKEEIRLRELYNTDNIF